MEHDPAQTLRPEFDQLDHFSEQDCGFLARQRTQHASWEVGDILVYLSWTDRQSVALKMKCWLTLDLCGVVITIWRDTNTNAAKFSRNCASC